MGLPIQNSSLEEMIKMICAFHEFEIKELFEKTKDINLCVNLLKSQ